MPEEGLESQPVVPVVSQGPAGAFCMNADTHGAAMLAAFGRVREEASGATAGRHGVARPRAFAFSHEEDVRDFAVEPARQTGVYMPPPLRLVRQRAVNNASSFISREEYVARRIAQYWRQYLASMSSLS